MEFLNDQRLLILFADAAIVFALLLTVTIRVLSRAAGPVAADPAENSPKNRKSGQPLTIDELNIDLPL